MLFRYFSLLIVATTVFACVPPGEEAPVEGVVIDLNDPISQRIYDYQNQRLADSLLPFFEHDNPGYRYLSARALGSFPELSSLVVDSLMGQLRDPQPIVRRAASYALGQTEQAGVTDALTAAFDQTGGLTDLNAEVLAAIGKTGDGQRLEQISTISTYRATDTTLLAGQAWSIFYFATRQVQNKTGDDLMLRLLLDENTPPAARQPAAFFLQRFTVRPDSNQLKNLRQVLRVADDPVVLMGAINVLGKSRNPAARVALLRLLSSTDDWRIRVEIVRALRNFDYAAVREPMVELLRDSHPLVRRSAADFLLDQGTSPDATFYRNLAQDSLAPEVRYRLYGAANRHLPLYFTDIRGRINFDLQTAYANESAPYLRAEILSALAEFPWNYRTIYELYQQSSEAPVRTAAATALAEIAGREDFATFFRASTRRVRTDLAAYFRGMIESAEAGPAYVAANALEQNAGSLRPFYLDLNWLEESLARLSLPREIETHRAVAAAAAALRGEAPPAPQKVSSEAKPINWGLIAGEGAKTVRIRTDVGRIDLRMLPEAAPATVSSFLTLVQEGYYDGKQFHRVVPNFVAQGGGPRGDGFGSEDFIIRTETPGLRWDRPGLVGMASAGKDTEGVQFFITHRATPHLDGNYTIFAEVIDGQDVVDNLTIGSRIESIQIR
jgi:cyclophilin family peptidyl-prolyl cis-trans isomerase/HEAT repeat protein